MTLEHRKIKIDKNTAGLRIAVLCAKFFPEFSRTALQSRGIFKCEGFAKASKTLTQNGESWEMEITKNAPRLQKLTPWEMPLKILHDSKSWCAVEKPVGISTHFSPSENSQKTLANALLFHFGKNLAVGKEVSEEQEIICPGIVHRLDKTTSGVVLVAKTDEALRFFHKNWSKVEKIYLAIVSGRPPLSGKIEGGILRDPKNRQKMTVSFSEKAKTATTLFWRERANESKNLSLLKVQILTGRTHQIRVHLAAIGFSILGDEKYGGALAERVFLHAHSLKTLDPDNHKKQIEIKSDTPAGFNVF
jgi:23S rRNA pseudouridine1911/1915/1917 synthase